MIRKKLRQIIPITLLLISAISIIGVKAYFLDSDDTTNIFAIGSVTTEIVETFEPPEELAPGTNITKDIKVKNLGSSDCYVRVLAVFENSHMEQYCEIDWNTEDWDYNEEDGYWYYKGGENHGVLKTNELTTSLFTTIKIKDNTPISELAHFNIIVYTEGVAAEQGVKFTDYAQAWENYQKNKNQATE